MNAAAEPEIILPGETARGNGWSSGRRFNPRDPLSDENLDFLAALLDDLFRIPGTSIRFGLDPLIGLLPGIGDTLTAIVSFLIVVAGWRRGVAGVTLARMIANIALDAILGAVPVAGDLFDVAWKSNRKNFNLLVRHRRSPRGQTWRDWLFFGTLLLIALTLVVVPFAIALLLVQYVWHLIKP